MARERRGADKSTPWVSDRLGISLSGPPLLTELVGLALRRNPRRAQLLVSTVLGKHMPADPAAVVRAGRQLACAIQQEHAAILGDAVVVAYAETATALGHLVSAELDLPMIHSTRREVAGIDKLTFEEEHSHATAHRLLPDDPSLLDHPTVVLVDDEFSTGRTIINTVRSLEAQRHRSAYVAAALVDVRSEAEAAAAQVVAHELGTQLVFVSLCRGTVDVPGDTPARAELLMNSAESLVLAPVQADPAPARRSHVLVEWPQGAREGGRHGFHPTDVEEFEVALRSTADSVRDALISLNVSVDRVHVLGTEELMYLPLRLAEQLADGDPKLRVTFSSTTRSPIAIVDDPAYPVRSGFRYRVGSADRGDERFVYNLMDSCRGNQTLVLVVVSDAPEDLPPLLDVIGLLGCEVVTVRVDPDPPRRGPLRGPAFGTYASDDVGWLLTDLSGVELERGTAARESDVQARRVHYSESLPEEYRPTSEYSNLYDRILERNAQPVAVAVAVLAELLIAERGRDLVLASFARAGTPVGILMRRWIRLRHGRDVPHYAVSIIRGRGIDEAALRWMARTHDPSLVVFVDGWTGKGAITEELSGSLRPGTVGSRLGFRDEVAVLADPGHCTAIFATRDDLLIPSACLNSTVSGLISRTVLNRQLLRNEEFHGAKFYRDLKEDDVSDEFVAAVERQFPTVDVARAGVAVVQSGLRAPDWLGRDVAERLRLEYGLPSSNLVKPGLGETTRVLLRRTPWRVLIREGASGIEHIQRLADDLGVPVESSHGLPFRAVGLIRPVRQ